MVQTIGELILQSGKPLLKMWSIDVAAGVRPYVKHSHSRFEITVVNSGVGEYTTEKKVYPMEPGDVFVFSSNEVHSITNCGEEGLNITNLHFEPRYLEHNDPLDPGGRFVDLCFSHAPNFENRIPAQRAGVLQEQHRKIKEEFLKRDELHPVAVKAHLQLLLIELFRNQGYGAITAGENKNRTFNMLTVYDYVEQHLCEEITLSELAELVHLSPNYFSHLFKQLNGISLWEYITIMRVEKAKRLICTQNERQTMMEVALQCGFNNTVNFNKAFKRHTGITPSQLRRDPKLLSH